MVASDKVHVLKHPLVNARLSKLRQMSTTGKEFREVCSPRNTPYVLTELRLDPS